MRITIDQALDLLEQGKVVAIPTDTVYGLAADMHNASAVDQIFAIKNRPNDKPLITLIAQQEQMIPFVEGIGLPPDFDILVRHFWPGALTLVIPIKAETIPHNVRAGLQTAGFRIPNHSTTRELLTKFGPVVAPSANLSAGPSSTSAEHVVHDFGEDFPVLDGGACAKGVESTILCFQEGEWRISRLGAIGVGELEKVLGYAPKTIAASALPQALASNYVPKVKVRFSKENYDGSIKAVLGFTGRSYPGAAQVFLLGLLSEPDAIAANLYSVLREIDRQKVPELWVDADFPREGVLKMIADKLESFAK